MRAVLSVLLVTALSCSNDDGVTHNNDAGSTGNTDAGIAQCGNGIIETLEACDDGNTVDTDGCLNTCVKASCGDGLVRTDIAEGEPDYESCDDGNRTQTDPEHIAILNSIIGKNSKGKQS